MLKKIIFLSIALFSTTLLADQTLEANTNTHFVEPNESVFIISERYGVTPESIKRINNLSSSSIEAGETITVPRAITAEDRDLMAKLVYAEAKGEPYAGQVAVATVILNRLDHPDYPNSIYDVVYQVMPSGHYAFSPVLDGSIVNSPDHDARQAVDEAISHRGEGQQSIYFYNPVTATSEWVATREQTIVIGDHVFAK